MKKYLNLSSIIIILMTFLSCQKNIDLNEVINQDSPFILTQQIQKVESEYSDFKIDTLKINSEKWKEFITFMTNNKDNWKSTPASYNSDFNITQNEFRLLGWKDGKSVTYAKQNGKYGLIDYNGEIILPLEYDDIFSQKFFDYYIVKGSEKSGMFDKNGTQIISFSYQNITPAFYEKNERFIVQQNGLFGVIDLNENIIIPIEFEEISNWVEYGPKEHFITKNGKKGLISRNGEIVIPPEYDEITVDNSILIKVEKNGLFGTINWKNEIVHPMDYEQILWEWPYLTNKELDTVYLKKNGEYLSTDTKGKVLEQKVSKKIIDDKFGYLLNFR